MLKNSLDIKFKCLLDEDPSNHTINARKSDKSVQACCLYISILSLYKHAVFILLWGVETKRLCTQAKPVVHVKNAGLSMWLLYVKHVPGGLFV